MSSRARLTETSIGTQPYRGFKWMLIADLADQRAIKSDRLLADGLC